MRSNMPARIVFLFVTLPSVAPGQTFKSDITYIAASSVLPLPMVIQTADAGRVRMNSRTRF